MAPARNFSPVLKGVKAWLLTLGLNKDALSICLEINMEEEIVWCSLRDGNELLKLYIFVVMKVGCHFMHIFTFFYFFIHVLLFLLILFHLYYCKW